MSRVLIALFVLIVLTSPRAAGATVLRGPASHVAAGESVDFEWSELPADADELELELSLDGGRWIRISPELDARTRRWTWRVPDAAAAQAVVRLRAGEREDEREVARSEPFAITSGASSPLPSDDLCRDWWSALAGPAGAPGSDAVRHAPSLEPALGSTAEGDDTIPRVPPPAGFAAPGHPPEPRDPAFRLIASPDVPTTTFRSLRN